MGAKSVRKVEIAASFARKVAIGAILGPVEGGAADGLGARGWGLWDCQFPALNGLLNWKAVVEIYTMHSFAQLYNQRV